MAACPELARTVAMGHGDVLQYLVVRHIALLRRLHPLHLRNHGHHTCRQGPTTLWIVVLPRVYRSQCADYCLIVCPRGQMTFLPRTRGATAGACSVQK